MGLFDPNTFAQMTLNESNSTEVVLPPAQEYPATVEDKKIETWRAKDGSSEGLKMLVFWRLDDPSLEVITGRAKNLVRQEMMFDLTELGGLDMGKGKNVRLGRLREALNLNRPGDAFNFDMIVGRSAKVVVSHRPDTRDPNIMYAEVSAVARP